MIRDASHLFWLDNAYARRAEKASKWNCESVGSYNNVKRMSCAPLIAVVPNVWVANWTHAMAVQLFAAGVVSEYQCASLHLLSWWTADTSIYPMNGKWAGKNISRETAYFVWHWVYCCNIQEFIYNQHVADQNIYQRGDSNSRSPVPYESDLPIQAQEPVI